MAGVKDYSTTAGSNTSLFPEGMTPSSVNDGMRQVQADIRSLAEDMEWFNWGDSPSRASSTTFKIATNVTTRYAVNRRIKCYDGSTLYGTITASSYSNPDTTVTVGLDTGSLTTSLSSVSLAILSSSNLSVPSTIGRKGADVASATTTDLSTVTADFVDITGTTTITGLGTVDAGVERTVRFTGALTLTHNSTSLILPGGANITTADGDTAIFRSLGSGNWKCIAYQKASGLPVVSPSTNFDFSGLTEDASPDSAADYVLSYDNSATAPKKVLMSNLPFNTQDMAKISTATASSSSSLTFTGLSSTYKAYCFICTNITPASDNVSLYLRTSTDGGSTYDSGASNYQYANFFFQPSNSGTEGSGGDTKISLASGVGSNTDEKWSGVLWVTGHDAAFPARFVWQGSSQDQGDTSTGRFGHGYRNTTADIDAVQFSMSSGNIASGSITLYGLKA